jgi:hypothetical protein
MKKSENEGVQNFLEEIKLVDSDKSIMLIEIRDIILNAFPKTKEKVMYGGLVFFLNDEMFSGVFLNKKHVTLEFSTGYLMEDPKKALEGRGKYRRHLKILSSEDILNKEVSFFVKQAV